MRTTGLVMALALVSGWPPAAEAKPDGGSKRLQLGKPVDVGRSPGTTLGLQGTTPGLIANPRTDFVVWARSETELVVRRDNGKQRVYAKPAECSVSAVAPDVLGLDCFTPPFSPLRLLDLRTGDIATPDLGLEVYPGADFATLVLGAGRRWLHVDIGRAIVRPQYLVNRATGRIIDLAKDPFGARRTIDLDAPSGSRPLCGGIRRPAIDPYKSPRIFDDLTLINRRVLSGVGYNDTGEYTLRDCRKPGSSLDFRGPAGADAFTTLNAGYLATTQGLTQLATMRRAAFTATDVALSRGTLWRQAADGTVTRLP